MGLDRREDRQDSDMVSEVLILCMEGLSRHIHVDEQLYLTARQLSSHDDRHVILVTS